MSCAATEEWRSAAEGTGDRSPAAEYGFAGRGERKGEGEVI